MISIEHNLPLVSCIMPTYNRRAFVPHAINYFLRQDYPNKELIIIDDGTDMIKDLVPNDSSVHYYQLENKFTLGAKLNMACEYAQGNIIANWDDDDWYAPRRLSYQVKALNNENTEVCGINTLLYFDVNKKTGYKYIYPSNLRTWMLGSSLCYKRGLWQKNKFADINIGMDGLFVWATPLAKIKVLEDFTFSVHMIHNQNVSPKKTNGSWWHPYPVKDLESLINTDWHIYANGNLYNFKGTIKVEYKAELNTCAPAIKSSASYSVRNIFACLVHENEDCILDLVRNLHYHDPNSIILLYNGGKDPDLLHNKCLLEKFGAVIHPNPHPLKHGYLHDFALQCMQFALDNFTFDTLTIVDSDQVLIRSGYSNYLGDFLHKHPEAGMLSSKPEKVRNDDKTNYVALQAFKEYELWKP
jgi:glycosyltransferase involved in cell wall biosynthesis